jgi:hypothetical protein
MMKKWWRAPHGVDRKILAAWRNCAKNLYIVVEKSICYGARHMILFQIGEAMRQFGRNLTISAFALTLVACAPVDDTIGSRLAQPAAGTPPQKPVEVNDIVIAGQEVAHSIMDTPIDTDPYTELLRDRLLLLTREKLRFVEHTLPPYVPPSKKGKKAPPQPVENTTEADYQILAELRGHAEDEFYKIQVEFVDIHTKEVLFSGVYRIRREASVEPSPESSGDTQAPLDRDTTAPPAHAANGNESL